MEKYNTKENSDVIFKEIYEATWWKFIHEIISLKWILVREKIKTFVKKNDMKNWIIKNILKIIASVPTYVSYIGYWFFSPNLLPYLHVIFFTDVSLCSYAHKIIVLHGKCFRYQCLNINISVSAKSKHTNKIDNTWVQYIYIFNGHIFMLLYIQNYLFARKMFQISMFRYQYLSIC